MGIYVTLAINPHCISHEKWQEVYEESLTLLRGFPAEMLGIQRERVYSTERQVYSRRIERDVDDPGMRHWFVAGDFSSMELAESFIFRRNLDHYRSRVSRKKCNANNETIADILVDLVEENGEYCRVFSDKTQGKPYHIPLLAVAMLVEDHFPLHSHASGDIDIYQAREAQAFAQTVLGKEVALPVAVDGPRLFERIRARCDEQTAIEHFGKLFRGESDSQFETVCKMSGMAAAKESFLKDLCSYNSSSQLGAQDLCVKWLNVTGDLKTLCEMSCLDERGPKFDPESFAETIASTWISIEQPLRSVMDPFQKPRGAADTVASQLGSVVLDMRGLKGRTMRFYIPETEVLEILATLFPGNTGQIEGVFTSRTKKIRENLAESQSEVERLIKRDRDDPEYGDGSSFIHAKSIEKLSRNQDVMLHSIAYALSQFRDSTQFDAREILQQPPARMHELIVVASEQGGITLTEDAWKWIDQENDPELLKFVFMLVLIANQEQKFWNVRKGLLENRELCKGVLEMTWNQQLMAEIGREVERGKKRRSR